MSAPATANVGHIQATGDFDGDGNQDLVLTRFSATVSAQGYAGTVEVLYGGSTFSTPQVWHQDIAGVPDDAENGDVFGSALAIGDFNGDTYDDLAVGAPWEDIGSVAEAGAINVFYGGAGGLTAAGSQFWSQGSAGIVGSVELGDHFGNYLASGDFDGDGFADLAVGVPDEDIGSIVNAGTVQLLYGSANGLAVPGNRFWDQNSSGIHGTSEAYDRFGRALATGDFNDDGWDDLAVGVPLEGVGGISQAGAVNIFYGGPSGITSAGNQIWDLGAFHPSAFSSYQDLFGHSLATGDFDGDGYADLAAGAYRNDHTFVNSGVVAVFSGSASGLAPATTGLTVLTNREAAHDEFGYALAAGDFDDDGFTDLAIGKPGWQPHRQTQIRDSGAVWLARGDSSGLLAPQSTNGVVGLFWRQGVSSVPGVMESYDAFGSSLATGDFNGDGYADLVVGVPGEDSYQGAANVIFGSASRLTGTGSLILY